MAAKIGGADRAGNRKSVAMLSNEQIVKKSNFRPRERNKIEAILRHRGISWDES